MKKEIIKKIALENKLPLIMLDTFIEFFSTRFSNVNNEIHCYCIKWVKRFKTGNHINYMDIKSRKIYKKILFGDL